jgi:hypothetical protein
MDELRDTAQLGCVTWDEFAWDAPVRDDFVSDDFAWDGPAQDDPSGTPGSTYKALSDEIDDALDELLRLDLRRAQLAALEMDILVRIAGAAEQRREVIVLDEATDSERLLTISDEAREEVAAALQRSPTTVHDQIVAARLLFGPLRRTLDALAAGRISEGHARIIAQRAEVLHRSLKADDAVFAAACAALEDLVLVRAESGTRAQLQRWAKAAVAAIDATGERERRRAARETEDVRVEPDDYGISVVTARLQTADAERIRAAVNLHAASDSLATPCDATLGQRRVAALLDLVCGANTTVRGMQAAGGGPATDSRGAEAMGCGAEAVGCGAQATAPRSVVGAEISIVVTLDEFVQGAGVVGALLEDPQVPLTLRRLITDPQTGRALDLGRRRYEISDPLRRWIVARDRTCRFPGCSRRASACQIDHVVAWTDDGGTDAANLHALCIRHHQLKTIGGWQVSREDATGLTVWTSPTGRTYWVDPEPVVPPAPPPSMASPPRVSVPSDDDPFPF